jgi:spermidine synthase
VLVLDTLWHSYVDLDDPRHLEFSYLRGMVAGIEAHQPGNEPMRALLLGGGGFTLPRFLGVERPGTSSLVYEIDGGVVDLDRRRLGLRTGGDTGIDVRIGDARLGLAAQPDASRDLVVGDAFGGLAVPWHLTTREVVRHVQRVLTPGGLYALNVIDHPPLAFARAEVATVADVFAHVAVVADAESLAGRDGGNFVVLASDDPIPVPELQERLADRAPELDVVAGPEGVAQFVRDARVLTDDYAPVDQLLTP